MSFLVYQRSDPRTKDWLPLLTQQLRLRNVIQILGLNLDLDTRDAYVYFTLHTRAMSTPFFTSEKLQPKRRVVTWKEIEPRQIPESVRLSAPGFIIRVWCVSNNEDEQKRVASWGICLNGLHYLGSKGDWNTKDFGPNTLLFRMPFGFYTSLDSLVRRPLSVHRYVQIQVPSEQIKQSYTLKKLSSLHSVQRSILDEISMGVDLKSRICLYGYSQGIGQQDYSKIYSEKSQIRVKEGRARLQLKEKVESMRQRVNILRDEKVRRFGRVIQLKKDFYEAEDISTDLMGRMQMLGREIERLKELKLEVQERKIKLSQLSSQLFRRKKELISELLLIYPLTLVEGSKKYSINEVQLPIAEEYGTETGAQISVALGYTAHLTAMISFFLGIPLRYPIRHFGSQSRIVDHITEQITDREREFPLYFRNKEDVYSRYAVYLLNKNIAQLRWYCGLSTPELRATLPNIYNLLHTRLIIPGWPPSPAESLEVAQELTEANDQQLFSCVSLDKGLDQLLSVSPAENGLENPLLRSSFSDCDWESLANNSVPHGEVKHGKAQDRFLNGWRQKTYEYEEIEDKWLTNSLNLDFDAGRRLSTTSTINPNRPPLVMVSDDPKMNRRRRYGRVEQFPFTRRGSGSSTKGKSPEPIPNISINITAEPNDNLSNIENEITKYERRKSLIAITSPNTSSPTQNLQSPTIEQSLALPLSKECDEDGDVSPNLPVELQPPDLEPMYCPSSDERETVTPIPPLDHQHIPTSSILIENIPKSPASQKLSLELFPISTEDGLEINPLNLPVDDQPTFESTYRIPPPPAPLLDESILSSSCESEPKLLSGEDDEAEGDDDEEFNTEDESLWLRTAALLNPQSFNQIKRRISDSN